MRLTGVGKAFVTLVILGVLGFAAWYYKGDAIRRWVGTEQGSKREAVSSSDFDSLRSAPPDPGRGKGADVAPAKLGGSGKIGRTLVVGINTWAGHAPGIVCNGGMEPGAASGYRQRFGLDVKFVLLEDPAAKLAAFR